MRNPIIQSNVVQTLKIHVYDHIIIYPASHRKPAKFGHGGCFQIIAIMNKASITVHCLIISLDKRIAFGW